MDRTLSFSIGAALLVVSTGSTPMRAAGDSRTAMSEMHVAVEADRILIGSEFVPRWLDLPKVLRVPAGETMTLPAESRWDYIEVAGTLRVQRSAPTWVQFTHLVILPGGYLDAGTEEDPLTQEVVFEVRDAPLDADRDPFQWGNGILNFGRWTAVGLAKTPWTKLTAGVPAGATHIAVEDASGWQVGDELAFVDTRQASRYRREPAVSVAAVSGATVTLSRPLDFEHQPIRDVNGTIVLQPRVANLARNVVIQSQAGAAVHGHAAQIGGRARGDLRYVEFRRFGRTRAEPLDDTRNRIGKYGDHLHHTQGFGSFRIGNSYRGDTTSKWAVVVHVTSDAVVDNNVCVDVAGSCFVTESGPEVRNVWRRNFAAFVSGGNPAIHPDNLRNNCPGCEDSGFWFQGLQGSVIEDNEAWNTTRGMILAGQNSAGMAVPGVSVPGQPGGPADAPFNPSLAVPASVRGNIAASNLLFGLELWDVPQFPIHDQIMAYNGHWDFGRDFTGQFWPAGIGVRAELHDPTLVSSFQQTPRGFGPTAICIRSSSYTPSIEIYGGTLSGCQEGVGTFGHEVVVEGTTLQNAVNLNLQWVPQRTVRIKDVTILPLPEGKPSTQIIFGEPAGGSPNNGHRKSRAWHRHDAPRRELINLNGNGRHYLLYEADQRYSADASPWIARKEQWTQLLPASGLTMEQAWRRFGMALWGEAVPDAEVIQWPGMVNGFARLAVAPRLGPPRAILTWPNTITPAPYIERWGQQYVEFYVSLTGDPAGLSSNIWIAFDGGEPVRAPAPGSSGASTGDAFARWFLVAASNPGVAPGRHTATLYRESASGDLIPSEARQFDVLVSGTDGIRRTPPIVLHRR